MSENARLDELRAVAHDVWEGAKGCVRCCGCGLYLDNGETLSNPTIRICSCLDGKRIETGDRRETVGLDPSATHRINAVIEALVRIGKFKTTTGGA